MKFEVWVSWHQRLLRDNQPAPERTHEGQPTSAVSATFSPLRGETRMITPGRTPTAWLPTSSLGLVRRGSSNIRIHTTCSLLPVPMMKESLPPGSFSQQRTSPALGLYHLGLPCISGYLKFQPHCPKNTSSSYSENQKHPKHFQTALGLWHYVWLRTTAVFPDDVHLYKYSVFYLIKIITAPTGPSVMAFFLSFFFFLAQGNHQAKWQRPHSWALQDESSIIFLEN